LAHHAQPTTEPNGGTIGESLDAIDDMTQPSPDGGPVLLDVDALFAFLVHFMQDERIRNPKILFPSEVWEDIQTIFFKFDRQLADGTRNGLHTAQIFEVWSALGRDDEVASIEEKKKMLSRIQLVDLDNTGLIKFDQFAQLLRIYILDRSMSQRAYELKHTKASRFTRAEVSELREVFHMLDEAGTGEIDFIAVKGMFRDMGCDLKREDVDRLYAIMDATLAEVDANDNKLIDFGEFLMLMRVIIEQNFAGIADKLKIASPPPASKAARARAMLSRRASATQPVPLDTAVVSKAGARRRTVSDRIK